MHHEDRAGVNALIRGISQIATEAPGVLVVMCTNRIGALDPAIRRRAAAEFDFARPDAFRFVLVVAFRPASADWFGYDAFPRLGNSGVWAEFVEGKNPAELALFGIPRPGHAYWNAATVDAMAHRHPGLDISPWRDALE